MNANWDEDWYHCIHEAAHAVIGNLLGLPILEAVVAQGRGGRVDYGENYECPHSAFSKAVFHYAGPEASDVKLEGRTPDNYRFDSVSDEDSARKALAKSLPSSLESETHATLLLEAVDHAKRRARELVEAHWEEIQTFARRLKVERRIERPF